MTSHMEPAGTVTLRGLTCGIGHHARSVSACNATPVPDGGDAR